MQAYTMFAPDEWLFGTAQWFSHDNCHMNTCVCMLRHRLRWLPRASLYTALASGPVWKRVNFKIPYPPRPLWSTVLCPAWLRLIWPLTVSCRLKKVVVSCVQGGGRTATLEPMFHDCQPKAVEQLSIWQTDIGYEHFKQFSPWRHATQRDRETRKLSYCKDDRAMRPTYGCPVLKNFKSP